MVTRRVTLSVPYLAASLVVLALTTLASAVGLFAPVIYRDAAPLLPQLYGQDLVTLVVAVPALAVTTYLAARGSLRGYVGWLGVVGYLLYTYASYAVMTAFNELYLVYVALFGLTLYAFVGGLVRLDAPALRRAVDDRSTRPYVGFLLGTTALVALAWLSDVVPAVLAGTVPAAIAGTDLPAPVIQSLDLAVLLPAFVLTAYWLRREEPWGYALAGVLLVKIATLGLAVVAMGLFSLRAGEAVPTPLLVVFGLVSLLALVLMGRFLRSIRPAGATGVPDRRPSRTTPGEPVEADRTR